MLVLVGASISFSTLHSHHDVEWNHTEKHTDSKHCITENTNVCPICGYLVNAAVPDSPRQALDENPCGLAAILSQSQLIDPFTGKPAGRSPPAIG